MPVVDATVDALREAIGRAGVDVRRLGVGPIADDEGLAMLWSRAIARCGRRTLPLEVGLEMPLGQMGVVDYLAASSATVGAALTVTQQVFPLVGPGVQLLIERLRTGTRRVTIVDQPPFPGQLESDLLVPGLLVGRLKQLASRPPDFPLVELAEPEPGARTPFVRLLAVPRLRFAARRSALHLSQEDWATPLRNADPRLLATLKAMVGVEQRSVDALLVAVRALVAQRLPAAPALAEVAPALGFSTRSLQRRLEAAGTTFARVVDELRRDRAEQLVGEGLWTLGEVAARVGFAEPASFTRAWRRWRGEAPSEGRRRRARRAARR